MNMAGNTGDVDIQPYFEVDFGEQNLPAGFMTREFDSKRMGMLENEIYKEKKYIKNIEYNMTTDYVQYSFSVGGTIFNGIYSKEGRKNILYNGTRNDVYELPILGVNLMPGNMAYSGLVAQKKNLFIDSVQKETDELEVFFGAAAYILNMIKVFSIRALSIILLS